MNPAILGVIATAKRSTVTTSYLVNVSAVSNCGLSSAVGIVLSGLNPIRTYALTLPSGQFYTAWNNGVNYRNTFVVTSPGGDIEFGDTTGYLTMEDARAAFSGGSISGYDSYTFWLPDNFVDDNFGGLSISVVG